MWGVSSWEKIIVKNERIYESCVRSAMLYGSKTWCQKKDEMAILRRNEKAMMRAMCGVKIIKKCKSQELISLLGLKDTLDGLARVSGVRWYGHVLRRDNGNVLRRDNGNVLRRALDFEVVGRRGHG